jgi:hypothetical protein
MIQTGLKKKEKRYSTLTHIKVSGVAILIQTKQTRRA